MKTKKSKPETSQLLILLLLLASILFCLLPRIPQDQTYHHFADSATLYNLPNFRNVVSNLPFLLIGITGILYVLLKRQHPLIKSQTPNYFVFFIGITLTGIGSAYYHTTPDNSTLVWDRLPMTISFMSFFSIIIIEYTEFSKKASLLITLLSIGILSVLYWCYTEYNGQGDLRLYIIVQFLPMIIIPVMLSVFKANRLTKTHLWIMLLLYAASKISERLDHSIFDSLSFISGHTLKHLLAAAAPLTFLIGIAKSLNKNSGQK